jgi:hypothetical protein
MKVMKISTKSIFLAISATLFLVVTTFLKSEAQKSEFGLRFFPTISSFSMKTSSGKLVIGEANPGCGFGANLAYNFSKCAGIQGELDYITISQKYSELEIERRVSLRYLNIPILLSFNTDRTKPVNFNIILGPQIGICVGSALSITGNSGSYYPEAILSVKKGGLGLAYGAGVDFVLNRLGSVRLGAGFRGVSGLYDISDDNAGLKTNSFYILSRSYIETLSIYSGVSFQF